MDDIVKQTNLYAKEVIGDERYPAWVEVATEELKTWDFASSWVSINFQRWKSDSGIATVGPTGNIESLMETVLSEDDHRGGVDDSEEAPEMTY